MVSAIKTAPPSNCPAVSVQPASIPHPWGTSPMGLLQGQGLGVCVHRPSQLLTKETLLSPPAENLHRGGAERQADPTCAEGSSEAGQAGRAETAAPRPGKGSRASHLPNLLPPSTQGRGRRRGGATVPWPAPLARCSCRSLAWGQFLVETDMPSLGSPRFPALE